MDILPEDFIDIDQCRLDFNNASCTNAIKTVTHTCNEYGWYTHKLDAWCDVTHYFKIKLTIPTNKVPKDYHELLTCFNFGTISSPDLFFTLSSITIILIQKQQNEMLINKISGTKITNIIFTIPSWLFSGATPSFSLGNNEYTLSYMLNPHYKDIITKVELVMFGCNYDEIGHKLLNNPKINNFLYTDETKFMQLYTNSIKLPENVFEHKINILSTNKVVAYVLLFDIVDVDPEMKIGIIKDDINFKYETDFATLNSIYMETIQDYNDSYTNYDNKIAYVKLTPGITDNDPEGYLQMTSDNNCAYIDIKSSSKINEITVIEIIEKIVITDNVGVHSPIESYISPRYEIRENDDKTAIDKTYTNTVITI